jgi:hypothetical protein
MLTLQRNLNKDGVFKRARQNRYVVRCISVVSVVARLVAVHCELVHLSLFGCGQCVVEKNPILAHIVAVDASFCSVSPIKQTID